LLYTLLKLPAKFAFWIYCRRLHVNRKEMLNSKGPLLIAANHPNSFLDAIVLATLFRRPVYSLARGDAFASPFIGKLLASMKMFPVYRISEGVENLEHNYRTFEQCMNIFRKNGIVLIFSEGRCINEWHLRPLKKGTARLALSSWKEGIPLQVLPTGINYNSFRSFGKNIFLNFGNPISEKDLLEDASHGKNISGFNERLQTEFEQLVFEFHKKDAPAIRQKFEVPLPAAKKMLLFLPAALGWLVHFPLYYPLKKISLKKAAHNDHYDSVLTALLFATYPAYLILVFIAAYGCTGSLFSGLLFLLFPFCARSYVQVKKQF
jgi:1-acyl-sn-glycerol-3-phosphate acyltransferase